VTVDVVVRVTVCVWIWVAVCVWVAVTAGKVFVAVKAGPVTDTTAVVVASFAVGETSGPCAERSPGEVGGAATGSSMIGTSGGTTKGTSPPPRPQPTSEAQMTTPATGRNNGFRGTTQDRSRHPPWHTGIPPHLPQNGGCSSSYE
jgi:hypothetical protein